MKIQYIPLFFIIIFISRPTTMQAAPWPSLKHKVERTFKIKRNFNHESESLTKYIDESELFKLSPPEILRTTPKISPTSSKFWSRYNEAKGYASLEKGEPHYQTAMAHYYFNSNQIWNAYAWGHPTAHELVKKGQYLPRNTYARYPEDPDVLTLYAKWSI